MRLVTSGQCEYDWLDYRFPRSMQKRVSAFIITQFGFLESSPLYSKAMHQNSLVLSQLVAKKRDMRWVNWMQCIGKGLRQPSGEKEEQLIGKQITNWTGWWTPIIPPPLRVISIRHHLPFASRLGVCQLCRNPWRFPADFSSFARTAAIQFNDNTTSVFWWPMQILKICCDKNLILSQNVRIRFPDLIRNEHGEFDHFDDEWHLMHSTIVLRLLIFRFIWPVRWRWRRFRSTNHCCKTLAEIILLYKKKRLYLHFLIGCHWIGTYFSKTNKFVHIIEYFMDFLQVVAASHFTTTQRSDSRNLKWYYTCLRVPMICDIFVECP